MSSFLEQPFDLTALADASSVESRILNDLQGNILKFHGRQFATHLFVHFRDPIGAKKYLRAFVANDPAIVPLVITSAVSQGRQSEAFRKSSGQETTYLLSVLLSRQGYFALGIPEIQVPSDPAFQEGMRERGPAWLKDDPSRQAWETYFKQDDRERSIHAMIVIAHADKDILKSCRDALVSSLEQVIQLLGEDFGEQLYDRTDGAGAQPIEHFGYVDNISGPIFFEQDRPSTSARWDPITSPMLVLEKCAGGGEFSFGSYAVFRKLEQNVRRFEELQDRLASELCLSGLKAKETAGALIIGRFKDGRPLVIDPENLSSMLNDFDYSSDPTGVGCPFAAHIRKVNPRGSSDQGGNRSRVLQDERRHIIARRGITYGNRTDNVRSNLPASDRPESDVGLLFLCYQRSITEQFEHLQSSWANDEFFPILPSRARVGRDSLIGQGGPVNTNLISHCEPPADQSVSLQNCITLKGGEFFFAPSLSFFRHL